MKTIAYTGSADFQEFGPSDLAKVGVEIKKDLRFARAEPTEVEDNVFDAFMAKDNIFSGHQFIEVTQVGENAETSEQETEEQKKAAQKAADKAAQKAAAAGRS